MNADGGAGDDTLIVDNRGAAVRNLTVTNTAVTRADGKTVNYSNTKKPEVKTDGGAGNVNVVEKAAGTELRLTFGGAGNTAAFGAGVFEYQVGAANAATVTGVGNQVTVAGTLGLTLLPGLAAAVGTAFTVIDNQTDAPIAGIFNGLAEGAVVSVGGWQFRVSYVGQQPGDPSANDVRLTVVSVPSPGTISGRSWRDTNGNGIRDTGEGGVANVRVQLLNTSGVVVATAFTDMNGNYTFTGVASGSYRIQFVLPPEHSGATATAKDVGTSDAIDSDIDAGGFTDFFSLNPGQSLTDWDAGYLGI